jgi:hypothetical protein
LTADNIQTGTLNASVVSVTNLNADNITAGTITGRTLRTAAPAAGVGSSVVITGGSNEMIHFYYGATERATIKGYTTEGSEVTYLDIRAASGRGFKLKNSFIEVNGNLTPTGDNNGQTVGTSGTRWSVGWFEDVTADDITANVSLTKPGGSFMIDHPLKPETHILRHSFVESPDMLNIYKGRASVKNGKAKVQLPEYFEALNREIEYHLTPIGTLAQVSVLKEVKNNVFEIIASVDCEVSWVVYGVRQDKFAEENPIIIEEEKETPGLMYEGADKPNRFSDKKFIGKISKARKELKKSFAKSRQKVIT